MEAKRAGKPNRCPEMCFAVGKKILVHHLRAIFWHTIILTSFYHSTYVHYIQFQSFSSTGTFYHFRWKVTMLGIRPILLSTDKLSSQSNRKQGDPKPVHDSIETKVVCNFKTCSSNTVHYQVHITHGEHLQTKFVIQKRSFDYQKPAILCRMPCIIVSS
jgi:hypothetical protein